MNRFVRVRQTCLVLASITLVLGEMSSARADSFAFAENMITNFQIISPAGSIVGISGTRNTVNTAQYGNTFNSAQSPRTIPAISDALQAEAGPDPFPPENAFMPFLNEGTFNGARADSLTAAGSPFADDGIGETLVENVAEAELPDSAVNISAASSASNIANATYTFSVTIPTTITFAFNTSIQLAAATSALGGSAIASIANAFEIDDSSGLQVFLFTPTTCGAGNLQGAVGSTDGVPPSTSISADCSVSGTSPELAPGHYQVSLRSTSQADISSPPASDSTPELVSFLLLGGGIVFLCFMAAFHSAGDARGANRSSH